MLVPGYKHNLTHCAGEVGKLMFPNRRQLALSAKEAVCLLRVRSGVH